MWGCEAIGRPVVTTGVRGYFLFVCLYGSGLYMWSVVVSKRELVFGCWGFQREGGGKVLALFSCVVFGGECVCRYT